MAQKLKKTLGNMTELELLRLIRAAIAKSPDAVMTGAPFQAVDLLIMEAMSRTKPKVWPTHVIVHDTENGTEVIPVQSDHEPSTAEVKAFVKLKNNGEDWIVCRSIDFVHKFPRRRKPRGSK